MAKVFSTKADKLFLESRKENSNKVKFKNSVFEIRASKSNNYYYTLWCNGKIIDTRGTYGVPHNSNRVNFMMSETKIKQVLYFDASLFPEMMHYSHSNEEENGKDPFVVDVWRDKNNIEFDFFFSLTNELIFDMDINPFKQMTLFFELAKKLNYKTDFEKLIIDDSLYGNIYVTVPAKGNLYKTYKKLTVEFAKIMEDAAKKMKNKKLYLS